MTTLDEIYEDVDGIVHDSTWDSDKVIKLFNSGIGAISEIVLLPDLETVGNVATSITLSYVSLPVNYQRKLRDCRNITYPHNPIRIFESLPLMERHFSLFDIPGRVVSVAVKGRYLHYQHIPSASETLRINYFAKPTALEGHEEPSVLPAFADELLLNYACWKIYSVIEEGMEGQKTQTQYYLNQFSTFLSQLKEFIGPEKRKPVLIEDELWESWA